MTTRMCLAVGLVGVLTPLAGGALADADHAPPASGQPRRVTIADFQDEQALDKISRTKGITVSTTANDPVTGKRGIEVRVPPYSVHQDHWPRISLGTSGGMFPEAVDLSGFSKVRATVHNVTGALARVRFLHSTDPFNDGGRNLESEFFVIPGGTSMVCEFATAGFERTDPSAVRLMMIMFPVNEIEAVYRIGPIEAVYDPAEGSPMNKLTTRADSVLRQLQALGGKVDWNAVPQAQREMLRAKEAQLLAAAERISAECRKAKAAVGLRGKYRPLKSRLDDIVRQVGQFVLADKQDFYLWRISQYINVYRNEFPDFDSPPVKSIDVRMALDEFRDDVFMVSSCGRDLRLHVKLDTSGNLPARAIAIRQALYFPGADALGDGVYRLEGPLIVPNGESRQVWLRFDTRYSGLKPGDYVFNVVVRDPDSGTERSIPGTLKVWDFQLPSYDVLPNNTYVEFDNSDLGSDAMLAKAVQHMKMYGLNMVTIHPVEMPYPVSINADDKIVKFDTARFERRIEAVSKAWNEAPGREKLLFMFSISGIAGRLIDGKDIPWPTQRWQNVFAPWLRRLKLTTKKLGVADANWWFALNDESSEAALLRSEIPLAEIIKRIDPSIQLTCNSSAFINDPAMAKRYFELFDVLQPSLSAVENNPHLLKWLQSSRRPIWTYDAKPMLGRHLNLYDYYRVYAWKNYRYGIVGTGLWTYCAQGRSPWSEKPHGTSYGLVFRHPEKNEIVHSRRYEFYRQGLDDYRYILALKDAAKAKGPEAQKQADQLINQAVADITANPCDTDRCDKWRIRIAEKTR